MRKSLPIFVLGLLLGGSASAQDSLPATETPLPVATVRIALLRDMPSIDKTIQSVFQERYEGNIRVISTDKGKFTAINTLDVEDYLKGVVGREMSPSWPIEALKAQAVAARTHALFMAEDSLKAPYDLVANLSQAYRGVDSRTQRIKQAVKATKNEVVSFNGTMMPTLFHTSCGGHTAAIGEVWQKAMRHDAKGIGSPMAVTPGVYCSACADTAHYKWAADLTPSSFTSKVRSSGSKIGQLVRVEVKDRSRSGRVTSVLLVGSLGNETMSVEKLRQLVGYNVLKSGFFEVEKTSQGILFRGEGWGHGVGLCQYGAKALADKGYNYKQILAHYFPGSKLMDYTPSDTFVAWQKSKHAALN